MMVDMERSYITAGFFRYTMHRRFERQKQQEVLEKALTKARMKGKKLDNNNTGELDAHLDEAVSGADVGRASACAVHVSKTQ